MEDNTATRRTQPADTRKDDRNDDHSRPSVNAQRAKAEKNARAKSKKAVPIALTTIVACSLIGLAVLGGAWYHFFGDTKKTFKSAYDAVKNVKDLKDHFDQESLVKTFNEKKGEYSLKVNNFFKGMSLNQIKELFTPDFIHSKLEPKCDVSSLQSIKVPESYNFYKEHKKCRYHEIDQKSSSGYVEVLASTIKSRYCAAGHKEIEPSIDYLLASDKKRHGGKAGFLTRLLEDVKRTGIATSDSWKRYSKEDKHGRSISDEDLKKTDRIDVADFCFLTNALNIKQEIAKNGPVISVIEPYLEFLLYDKGVYHFDNGKKVEGKVFVKIVGWGKEKNKDKSTEFWLVETTWGKNWADEGIAKVRMNEHGSMLDSAALAVFPKLHPKDDNAKSK